MNIVANIIAFFHAPRTVESITAPITNIVTQLKDHAADSRVLKALHDEAAAAAIKLASEAETEASRAVAAAEKFASAFSL